MHRLISIIFFLNVLCLVHAQNEGTVPYSAHWHISELLQWDAQEDISANFNRSTSPLKDRFSNQHFQANDHARANEARVNCLSIFGTAGGLPAQGKADSSYYAFSYWEYCDLLVFWGGSASEGIILAPTAGVIDAAHRHGVPVYGTVFFPPLVYGGQRQWVYDFVQKEEGRYLLADKLIEVAKYYGFDGWFINQESGNIGEVDEDAFLAAEMRNLMVYYQRNSDLGLEWYDAMMEDGCVSWQHELNEKNDMFFQYGDTLVSEYMFLDFRSSKANLKSTAEAAKSLDRDLYEIFAGIDVQSNGYNTKAGYVYPAGANFDVIFPEGEAHAASLAFYVPSWTYHSSKSMQEFYQKESRFWVGEQGTPGNTQTDDAWKGVAHYVTSKSTINTIPFVTGFCTGQGAKYFRNGKDITYPEWEKGWSNLSRQDIQPSWKWLVESEGEALNVDYDFSDAYNGGNCLSVSGLSEHENRVRLFSTALLLDDESQFVIAFKQKSDDGAKLNVMLTFADGYSAELPVSMASMTGFWQIDTIPLSAFEGQELSMIDLVFVPGFRHRVDMKIGSLGISRERAMRPDSPSDLEVQSFVQSKRELTSFVKLYWKDSESDLFCYNIYGVKEDDSIVYLGSTTSNSYCCTDLHLEKGEIKLFLIETLSPEMLRSACSEVSL